MSVLSTHLFKITYIILSKGVPLLIEMILKDKNAMEFLSANKTLIAMLMIVIVLSVSLVQVRHQLYVLQNTPVVIKREVAPVKPTPPPIQLTDPPKPPDCPNPVKKKETILQRETSRELIKRRLEEIQ